MLPTYDLTLVGNEPKAPSKVAGRLFCRPATNPSGSYPHHKKNYCFTSFTGVPWVLPLRSTAR